MPPMAHPKKKTNSKASMGALMDGMADVLGRITLGPEDEQTIRSTISAAKNGSKQHIELIALFMMPKLPAAYVVDAITALCTVLDVPAFPPELPLPSSLSTFRTQALHSLVGLAQIPGNTLSDEQSPSLRILEENWPMTCNWIQHFHHELITSQQPKPMSPTKNQLPTIIMTAVPMIISNFAHRDEVFERLIMGDDSSLLNMLVKIWLTSEDFLPDPLLANHRYQCYGLLNKSLTVLDTQDPSGVGWAKLVQNILREVQGDAGVVSKKLLRQLRNPAKACKESFELLCFSLEIIACLIDERVDAETVSKFMDSFLKDNLVPLISKLLAFLSEDLANAPERRVSPMDNSIVLIDIGLRLLLSSMTSRNGPHWVALLFKLGFLRTVARILSSLRHSRGGAVEILTAAIGTAMPDYFCHQFVVASAINAVKDITLCGDAAKFEVSVLREHWMKFTNILLERTVMNTAYNRDFAVNNVRVCENCKKKRREISLFKCAGCHTSMYCSKECQTTSWNEGGHRSQCKEARELWYRTGMSRTTDKFINFVALAELRRHMPGVSQYLASDKNPSGIPLKDAFFTVSFLSLPPTITVRRIVGGGDNDGLPAKFGIQSFWGGSRSMAAFLEELIPSTIRLFVPGDKISGDAVVDEAKFLRRKPAQDGSGKNLAFVLDEVDRHVMDARKHFRPPAAGDEESPKTIYDYVEAKVAADLDVLAWLGFDFS